MFKLIYRSLWTTYPVDTFPDLDECERYCATHYDAPGIAFKRDTDGILKATIEADGDIVVLNVYEAETAKQGEYHG